MRLPWEPLRGVSHPERVWARLKIDFARLDLTRVGIYAKEIIFYRPVHESNTNPTHPHQP